jgi:hypothetical protein
MWFTSIATGHQQIVQLGLDPLATRRRLRTKRHRRGVNDSPIQNAREGDYSVSAFRRGNRGGLRRRSGLSWSRSSRRRRSSGPLGRVRNRRPLWGWRKRRTESRGRIFPASMYRGHRFRHHPLPRIGAAGRHDSPADDHSIPSLPSVSTPEFLLGASDEAPPRPQTPRLRGVIAPGAGITSWPRCGRM